MQGLFAGLGITNSFHVPFGIEPDVFHPWGPTRRLYDETTYLAIVDGRNDWLLRIILESWHRFVSRSSTAQLILLGRGLKDCLGRAPDTTYRSGDLDIAHYSAERISLHKIRSPLSNHYLAQLYRTVRLYNARPNRRRFDLACPRVYGAVEFPASLANLG